MEGQLATARYAAETRVIGRGHRQIAVAMTSSFEVFYAAHRSDLVKALSIAIGDDGLAVEAVDEAFTRAFHRWNLVSTFDHPQAWVYRTARNHTMSRFRRLVRDRRYAPKIARPETQQDQLPDPELTAALASLPAEQRNVLVLRYYLDWSISSVADALDVSQGTVKSRTSRALAELNRQLGGSR